MNEMLSAASSVRVTLEPGDYVVWADRPHEIVRVLSLQYVLLRDAVTNCESQASISEIAPIAAPCPASPVADRLSRRYIEEAVARERVLRPYVQGLERLSSTTMEVVCAKLSLKPRRVYDLIKKLKNCPRPTTITSRPRGPKKGKLQLDAAVERIVQEELKKRVRCKRSSGIKPIREAIEASCYQAKLKPPSPETIRQRVKLYARELSLRRKLGFKRAREQCSTKAGVIRTTAALALVECDHSPLDIFIVDSSSRQNIGRAFLTVVIDCHTRAILGFYLSLEPPCATSVALALHHAILPKDRWLAERGLGHLSWPMFGVFEKLQVDGGAELNGTAIQAGCLAWDIELSKRRYKEVGGIIERGIGKIQFAASDEPGASGSSTKYRREYDPRLDAQMTMLEAEIWVAQQIISFYHTDWHDTLQMSPSRAWELAHTTENGVVLPAVVTNARRLLLDFLPYEERVISPNGIHFEGERYWTSELSQYVSPGRKARIKYDARNISRIYVEVADGTYIDVPFADPSKEALPLFEHRHRRRQARRSHREAFDHEARIQAIGDRDSRRKSARRATRDARRAERLREAQKATANSHPVVRQPSQPPGSPSSGRLDYSAAPVIDWDQGDV